MNLKYILFMGLVLILVACQSPPAATPAPTPEAVRVYYPPSLQPWADKLASCATKEPQVALYFVPSANPVDDIGANDIALEIGQPDGVANSNYIAQIGWEQVVLVVNQANPLSQMTSDKLKQVLSGQVTEWTADSAHTIQIWVLPQGDPVRKIFDHALGLAQPMAPDTHLAPDPTAILEAVAADEDALGYVPQSFMRDNRVITDGGVKVLQVENSVQQALHQPVLAYTLSEPSGYGRDLLVCVQNSSAN